MEDRKEKTKFWQSWMTVAILLGVTIMVIWFNAQGPAVRPEPDENISIVNSLRDSKPISIGNNKPISIGNNETISIGSSKHISIGNNTNVTEKKMDNDTLFKTWVGVSFNAINDNLNCISQAGYKKDIVNVENCGIFLRANSNLSLENMNRYSISPSIQNMSDEYRKALEDYNVAGINLEIGAKNRNTSQMALGAKYIKSGNMHIEVVNALFRDDNVTGEKFIHPNTVTNTT